LLCAQLSSPSALDVAHVLTMRLDDNVGGLEEQEGGRRDVKVEIKSGVTGGSIPWDELPGSVMSLLVIVPQECPRSLVRSIQAAPATAYSTRFSSA
jgi:hypothetical protein